MFSTFLKANFKNVRTVTYKKNSTVYLLAVTLHIRGNGITKAKNKRINMRFNKK
jgi:hypothetical protein